VWDDEDERLLASIEDYGVLEHFAVAEMQPDIYQIIDGHRRYRCAEKLALPSVPCRVHTDLTSGDRAVLRFHLQTKRKPWTATESAAARKRVDAHNA